MRRIAINGFGRIGRALYRLSLEPSSDFEVVAINDLTDTETLAHLLAYDSVWPRFEHTVAAGEDSLTVDGKTIVVLNQADPSEIDWSAHEVELVVESTGIFTRRDQAEVHLGGTVKTVLLSAPGKDVDGTFVMGVNESDFDPAQHTVVSNASCTTNCMATIVKAVDDAFGVESGLLNTVHAYTGDQMLVDGPHRDLRRARAAAVNIVPTTTGAARTVGRVMPHLAGKLDGLAIRVPVPAGSIIDFTFTPKQTATTEDVNEILAKAAEASPYLEYSTAPLVSTDIVGTTASAIVDSQLTMVLGKQIKVVAWYDNEWGYTNRLKDMVSYILGERDK
ncbi:MAG: type I glyceraldehyde-3-phosphate dehydrogenase [Brevibacterium sp.]|uniref:type I glyceraldehyde-3-phosphate dehydrogenase n=1 Tax=Brevibacterium sp. TaxID=1701 RepID=UPI002647E418|nr:type I glyceraldehyde-3-phosphate dehydrogenase [Brevibacterium sp.]MDN5805568.1 type I glyceraldehyde-3-phosphate dehydrogenase [Brevibacterium sp.]MDN5832383.1 type I glyceraldehyde-3-phosphate dehydrogenase [Brevibacterium sp.]MDN5876043.1 type I glyceraldehyde-3-phosphate dehydrogenase [Brevibacterium sp.]MDN5908313.1 type I glyceraldehyde-3-phosphate dehydrogenase [Brevibacterium sp.]MDN6133364.1 type I glyceraldehyde-3-phosphate dehydrogenase [Brevibacterium sp.]